MAFYDKFPYTNFQELNLDWITQEVSKVRDNRDASDASAAAAQASAAAAQASEQAAKASETAAAASQQAAANSETAAAGSEAASAEYLAKIGTHTAGAVADWLKENLTTTNPPVDATLTVSGAAADAKATGDAVNGLKSTLGAVEREVNRTYTENNKSTVTVNSVSADGHNISFSIAAAGKNQGVYNTGSPIYRANKIYMVSFDASANVESEVIINTRIGWVSFIGSGHFIGLVNRIGETDLANAFYANVTEATTITIENFHVYDVTDESYSVFSYLRDLMQKDQVTDSTISNLHDDIKDVRERAGVFDYDDITGNYNEVYYRNYIESLEGITGVTLFALQTDTHYGRMQGYRESINNITDLVQLSKLTSIPMVANLGDLVNGWARRPNQMLDIAKCVHEYLKCKSQYIQLVGNHDDNSWYANASNNGYNQIVDPKLWEQLVNTPIAARTEVVTLPNKRYGLWDDTTNHVRYIYLDTLDLDYTLTDRNGKPKYWGQWKYAIRQEQIDFLIDSLMMVGSNYCVVIMSHHSLADGTSYANAKVENADIVRGILEAFKEKTTYTGSSSTTDFEVSVTVDFSNTNHAGLIGCFAGHNHEDAMYTINDITYVQTDNSSVFETGDTGRSSSDTTADVIDVVRVNFTNKLVTLKRFGFGTDRTFTYN